MPDLNLEIILRLVIASLLGCIIGLERERRLWTAGMRTHMLVCVGAALFMLVSLFGFTDVLGMPGVELDPSRVAAQVVSGIGFLGAGTIIFRRDAIRGLTTAASLWVVAAIGLAVGGGLYIAAAVTTALGLFILGALKPLERRIFPDHGPQNLVVVANRAQTSLVAIESALRDAGVHATYLQWRIGNDLASDAGTGEGYDANSGQYLVEIGFGESNEAAVTAAMECLRSVEGVTAVSRAG